MDYIRVTEASAETITFLDVSFIKNIPSETFDLIRNIPAFIVYPFDTLYHSFLIYSKPFRRSMYILLKKRINGFDAEPTVVMKHITQSYACRCSYLVF